MATKKQKHQEALEKRARFLAEAKADGLKALRKDQERRAFFREKREREAKKKAQKQTTTSGVNNIHHATEKSSDG